MKKINLLIIPLLITFLFCGCGEINIICSIDQYNYAKMEIEISIPTKGLSEEEIDSLDYSIYELFEHWEDEDYEASINYAGDSYDLYLCKKVKGKDLEDAVCELLEMMGDDSSPFSLVEGGYSESYFNGIYNIRARIDLTNLLDYEYIETLPLGHKERITELTDSFSGNVSFEFIGTTKDYIGTITNGTNTVKLSFDEPVEIYSLVEISNIKNKEDYEMNKNELAKLSKKKTLYLMLLVAAVGAVFVSAGIIIVIAVRRKGSKAVEEKSAPEAPENSPSTETAEPGDDEKYE